MGLQDRMAESKNRAEMKKNVEHKMAKTSREYRCRKLLEAWSRVPEVGAGLKELPLQEAFNTAVNLDKQASYLATLNETQMSQGFNNFTPENMLRLVRLAMPNVVRSKIFTEFAMETARDSIKYVRPVFKKDPADVNGMKSRTANYALGADEDGHLPADMSNKFDDPNRHLNDTAFNDINDPEARRALYESTEDRFVQEFWTSDFATGTVTLNSGPFAQGMGYIDGYGVLYIGKESNTVAVQDKRTKSWYFNTDGYAGIGVAAASDILKYDITSTTDANGVVTLTLVSATRADATSEWGAWAPATVTNGTASILCRYDSENDLAGDYLGEVEIRMSDYEFKPRPTSIGVSWSQMTEIVLDTSFQVSAEEYLVTYASQEIRVALDYRAIKIAYAAARANPAAYHLVFDAAYNTTNAGSGTGTKEGYIHNAQTFMSVIDAMGDTMLNDINRGGVSRLVAGPSAGSYMRLIGGYSPKGKMAAIGAHQFGELEGIPLFKVPSSIIPNDQVLTVWKNDDNEADVAIAFGTLIPFFSTGVIQRKNFYKEAGIATYGDWQVLNYRYLGLIRIDNIKDKAVA